MKTSCTQEYQDTCLKYNVTFYIMQIFKDKNACLKKLCKYLKFQKRTSTFFFNFNSLRVCILKSNQCTH